MLEKQAIGVQTHRDGQERPEKYPRTNKEAVDLMAQTESVLMDNKGIFREVEGDDTKTYNYIETEQSRMNDMQMINYKSKHLVTYSYFRPYHRYFQMS